MASTSVPGPGSQPGFRNPEAVGDPAANPVIELFPGEGEVRARGIQVATEYFRLVASREPTASEAQSIALGVTAGILAFTEATSR